jgi:hypothetical protein
MGRQWTVTKLNFCYLLLSYVLRTNACCSAVYMYIVLFSQMAAARGGPNVEEIQVTSPKNSFCSPRVVLRLP